jgi:cobalt-zinc-cadmium efflux system membrane fusion protein
VVRENNADHLFVQARPGVFRLTRVELGPEKEGVRALAKPLPEGTVVVLDGAFHLNNVRNQQALGAK